MPVFGGGFEQPYNSQAAVPDGRLFSVTHNVTHAANDKRQLVPMFDKLNALPEALGGARHLLADRGYLREANVEA